MLSAIIVIIGLSILVLIHELGHFIAAKNAGLLVEEFGFGFPPRLFSWKKGETRYSINWLPFGGFVKIYGEHKHTLEERERETGTKADIKRSFAHQPIWKRFVIIAAGISINFIFGWLLLSLVFMIGARQAVIISQVQPGSPAEAAQLMTGNELAGFKTPEEFVSYTSENRGKPIELRVIQGGSEKVITVTPRLETLPGEGAIGVAVVGSGFERLSFFDSLWQGLKTSIISMGEILKAFGSLLSDLVGRARVPENIVGPIGIFGIAGELGSLGIVYVLQLIALISLNLAVLNFVPFPALDGGRLLFLIIEKIKGSPIHPKREFYANAASFGFLVILMIIITARDIVRLF